jgi:hypothetical protein|tara:strand:- start:877 stop:1026 length:150 start_codon:yes stop_codon:yes gene_type:complete
MATKEECMRKWIYEMNKYELQAVTEMVRAAQARLVRIADIEQEALMRGE